MAKIEQILNKEVTRRQFLIMLGSGVMGLLGLSTIMGLLAGNAAIDDRPDDYGVRNYGP